MKIVAVLACFNRREKTLECLQRLFVCRLPREAELHVVVVDDASPDGTGAAVASIFGQRVSVIAGPGNLFWNRGMHLGLGIAAGLEPSHYLWLNDDTLLEVDALLRLLGSAESVRAESGLGAVVVGATCDASGEWSYGGSVAVGGAWRPFRYRAAWSPNTTLACDVMNGNCVLVTRAAAERVGTIDPVFAHAMGDTDYALRARALGVPVLAAPGWVGRCDKNSKAGTYADRSLPFLTRWNKLLDRKGLPPRSWLHFVRRHGGWLWPLHFAWPYIKLTMESLRVR